MRWSALGWMSMVMVVGCVGGEDGTAPDAGTDGSVVCDGGPCAAPSCELSGCTTPPPNQCVDRETLRRFDGNGTCAVGLCSYGATEARCVSSSCRNGFCGNGPPVVHSLETDVTTLSPGGRVTFLARVGDPDGDGTVRAGSLVDPMTGALYGSFGLLSADTFTLTIGWDDVQRARRIDLAGDEPRVFRAVFFDTDAQASASDVSVTLSCDGLGACDGVCTDLTTLDNCGTCGNACAAAPSSCHEAVCRAGACVNDFLEGERCDDGSVCTDNDTCTSGACTGIPTLPPEADVDGDGFAAAALCPAPDADCDDTRWRIRPGAIEHCNGLDDDCDPSTADPPASECGAPTFERRFAFGRPLSPSANVDWRGARVDASGNNLYVVGTLWGTADLGGGEIQAYDGTRELVVASYTSSGAHRWSRLFRGQVSGLIGAHLTTAGAFIITGEFRETITLGDRTLTALSVDPPGTDFFVLSMAPATGAVLSASAIRGDGDDWLIGAAGIDPTGDIWLPICSRGSVLELDDGERFPLTHGETEKTCLILRTDATGRRLGVIPLGNYPVAFAPDDYEVHVWVLRDAASGRFLVLKSEIAIDLDDQTVESRRPDGSILWSAVLPQAGAYNASVDASGGARLIGLALGELTIDGTRVGTRADRHTFDVRLDATGALVSSREFDALNRDWDPYAVVRRATETEIEIGALAYRAPPFDFYGHEATGYWEAGLTLEGSYRWGFGWGWSVPVDVQGSPDLRVGGCDESGAATHLDPTFTDCLGFVGRLVH